MKKTISIAVLTALVISAVSATASLAKVDWPVKAANKIAFAESKEVKVLDEAAQLGITVDPQTIIDVEDLIVQAHAAFDAGNPKLANALAGQAIDMLDVIEEQIEAAEAAAEILPSPSVEPILI